MKTFDPNKFTKREERPTVEKVPGIYRTTMSYNKDCQLCYFTLEKGAHLDIHTHEAVQNGYVISGKIVLIQPDGVRIERGPGCGYVFDSNEPHGLEVLEDTEFIEVFTPSRDEYNV